MRTLADTADHHGSQGLFDKKALPRLVSEDAEQLIACATCSYHGSRATSIPPVPPEAE